MKRNEMLKIIRDVADHQTLNFGVGCGKFRDIIEEEILDAIEKAGMLPPERRFPVTQSEIVSSGYAPGWLLLHKWED